METNLDDLSPEITGTLIDRLLQLGALDAFLTPVQMKKNRPGVLLTVLTTSPLLAKVEDFIFRETTSFGIRISELSRSILEREFREVRTEFGAVTIKVGLRHGKILQRSPEFESCRKVAEAAGVSIREVFVAALAAASESR